MDRTKPILNLPPIEGEIENVYVRRIADFLLQRWGVTWQLALREGELHWKHFTEPVENIFNCETCGKVFTHHLALAGHKSTHRKEAINGG
uniref:C2H2-type domain-containing protein n=1 Tax=viral metagenome TaxID=1070528 RepID=A0A6M3XL35_9ZZZZ